MPLTTKSLTGMFALATSFVATAAFATSPAETIERLQAQIVAAEYHLSPTPTGGFVAPNRATDVNAAWEAGRVSVTPRSETGWSLGFELTRAGRPDALHAVAAPSASRAVEGRLEWGREGLVEWYENSARGLQQGFTIGASPAGEGALVLEGKVTGLAPRLAPGALSVDFADAGGTVRASFRGLVVKDAAGLAVPARYEVVGQSVRYVVEDAGAQYPIVIDPYVTPAAATFESGQGSANLGWDVAWGDVDGDGLDDIAIGAPFYESGAPIFTNEGQVFVFLATAVLPTPAGPANAHFRVEANQAGAGAGTTVAFIPDLDGDGTDELAVGAYAWDDPNGLQANEGAVWVYKGSVGTGLLNGPHADIMVGGNPNNTDWKAEGEVSGANLSFSLATGDWNDDGSGDIAVGAPGFGYFQGASPGGAAFVWASSGGTFAGGAKGVPGTNEAVGNDSWKAGHIQPGANFGHSVALGHLDGTVDQLMDIAVGARLYQTNNTFLDEGAVYVYLNDPMVVQDTQSTANSVLEGDQYLGYFGHAVHIADFTGDGNGELVVGAIRHATPANSASPEGSVFVYQAPLAATETASTAELRIEGVVNNSQTGHALGAADSDCDGVLDLVVGAPQWNFGSLANRGRVSVFSGATLFAANPRTMDVATQIIDGQAAGVRFGFSLAADGDYDGDGQMDLLVGAPYRTNPTSAEGAVTMYLSTSWDPLESTCRHASLSIL